MKKYPFQPDRDFWQWGGSPDRSGFSQENLQPPFQLLWKYRAPASLGRAIVASDSFLFFGTEKGSILALQVRQGKLVWKKKFRKKVELTCLMGHGNLIVIQRFGSSLLQLVNPSLNEIQWTQELGFIDGEPLFSKDRVFAGDHIGRVYSLDVYTGNMLWSRKMEGPVFGSIAQKRDQIFAASESGMVCGYDFSKGEIRWEQKLPGSLDATPVVGDSALFLGTREGRFYAISSDTGGIKWQFDSMGGVKEAAAVDNASVYFGTIRGILYCLDNRYGIEKWQFDTGGTIGTSPLITNSHVFIGTLNGIFYALDKETGKAVWQFETKGGIHTSPLIWKGFLVIACEARYLYGFRSK